MAKPDGLVIVDPATELDFLHNLPVERMWGVGPVTKARLAEIGVLAIGQLAKISEGSLTRLLGPSASEKLTALALNRDPRQIKTHLSTGRGISSLWGVQFSPLGGDGDHRLSDQDLRFLAVDRDA